MPRYLIYVDGSCRGNPGPAGLGIAIYKADHDHTIFHKISLGIGNATNNVAEYEAVIHALKWLKNADGDSAIIKLDSELVYNQILGRYKVREKHLAIQRRRLMDILKSLKNIEFQLIPREKNKVANRFAQAATRDRKKVKAVQNDIFPPVLCLNSIK